jgi:hypothetical protein
MILLGVRDLGSACGVLEGVLERVASEAIVPVGADRFGVLDLDCPSGNLFAGEYERISSCCCCGSMESGSRLGVRDRPGSLLGVRERVPVVLLGVEGLAVGTAVTSGAMATLRLDCSGLEGCFIAYCQ